MPIQQLNISGLRNLQQASLTGCRQVNIIVGPNGSGKTSILEAIHLLGLGRSFRSTKLKPIINFSMKQATVFASFSGGELESVGIQKSLSGKQELRINKEPLARLADLASALPLQVISSDSFSLVDGGPKGRRQFMDWGVFHVKPAFLELWRRAQRALKQRNSLLRRDKISAADLSGWDRELAFCAKEIDGLRAEYMTSFQPFFQRALSALLTLASMEGGAGAANKGKGGEASDVSLTLCYRRGWPADESLSSLLKDGYESDRRRGYTLLGPHRADIEVSYEGRPAADVLSRGQQKLVVCALKLAQGFCFTEQTGKKSLYLLDDLPAELDAEHRGRLCSLLHSMESQVFLTCVEADSLLAYWPKETDLKEFHVEQGVIV